MRNAKAPLTRPTAAAVCKLEYRGAVESISASLIAISRGASPGPAVLARCSSATIRLALIPVGPISRVVVTDTLPVAEDRSFDKLEVLSVAKIIADAIDAVFEDTSVSEIFGGDNLA